jgi:uncharacterized caspase-like protein
MRSYLIVLGSVLAALVFLPASADDGSEPIVLQIPQLQFNLDANLAATIENTQFDQMAIRISKNPQQVSYGTIYSKINTESANIVMTVTSDADGILCKFDLGHRAGFRMHSGRNSVELEYKDQMERVHYASFILQTEEKAPAPVRHASITPDRPAAGKFAVIIGVAHYQNSGSGLSNLQFADRDAEGFRDFLLSPEGGAFPKANVRVLLNEEATAQNVRSAFYTFLTQAQPTDEVVIYIAGHGAPDPNDPRNLYLLTYDTKLDDMGGTAFPMRQIQDVFANVLKAKRVVTFADTCHSFGFSGARRGKKNSNNLVNQYMAHYANDADRAVITASDISQLSYESDQFGGGHGVFTYYLLKGLHGEADANKDGTVTAGELFAYVRDNVAKATSGNQSPMAVPGLAERIPLSGAALRGTNRSSAEPPAVSHGVLSARSGARVGVLSGVAIGGPNR